jgi:hypothetical protein
MEFRLRMAALFSGFSSNCFRKIEARARVTTAMTHRPTALSDIAGIVSSGRSREKDDWPHESAQVFEKARFGQADPRQCKGFPWIAFAPPWHDSARFG